MLRRARIGRSLRRHVTGAVDTVPRRRRPRGNKQFRSIDLACEGGWIVSAGEQPDRPRRPDKVATITETTYGKDDIPYEAEATHVSLRFKGTGSGPKKISAASSASTVTYDHRPARDGRRGRRIRRPRPRHARRELPGSGFREERARETFRRYLDTAHPTFFFADQDGEALSASCRRPSRPMILPMAFIRHFVVRSCVPINAALGRPRC
jgi:hypothetical protein